MVDKSELKELLSVSIEIVSIVNELENIETMCGVDYSDVMTGLKWSRQMLRNRLIKLQEMGEGKFISANKYFEHLN